MKNYSRQISFIITVYKNDKLEFFKEAIESIVNQDYGFDNINIYLGIDGELFNSTQNYINDNVALFYKVVQNEENRGLAFTLNRLIEILEDEKYVFRMDADDICKTNRVSKQTAFMENHSNISIIGGAIEEFSGNGIVNMTRTYPKTTEEAKKFIPKASIFAHPTVCFKKSFFDADFKYSEQYRFSQDLALWYDALANGFEVSNIDDVVLELRVTKDFYKRRSYKKAFGEFRIYYNGIKKLYGFNWRFIYPVARLVTRLMPVGIVKIIYNEKFRKILNK
jgi:hypothetical protein